MNMSKETRFYVGGIIVVMAVVLLFSCGNAHAVNYGEPGHNPGNPGNPGVGGPPIDNGNGNGNNGSGGGTTIGDISGGSASIWSRIANTFAPTNTNQVEVAGGASTANNSVVIDGAGGSATATGGQGGSGGAATATVGSVSATGGATGPVSQSQTVQVGGTGSGTQRIQYSGSVRTVGIAPDVGSNNTAPCRVAVGVSGGWVGGALGLSGSVLDEGCDVWRDHENLVKAGFVDAATLRLCDKPEVAKVLAHCTKAVEVYPTKSGFVH